VELDNVHFEGSNLFNYINANLVTFHPIPGGGFDAVSNTYPTLVTPFHTIHIPSIPRQSQVVIDNHEQTPKLDHKLSRLYITTVIINVITLIRSSMASMHKIWMGYTAILSKWPLGLGP